MVSSNGKALFVGAVLKFALHYDVLATNETENGRSLWIKSARELKTAEFLNVCGEVFMSPDHLQQQSYLMSDFADEVTNLCLKIAPNPDQGVCQTTDFNNLDSALQNAFFRHAAQHMSNKKMPVEMMMKWGDAGYIVSDKTAIEQDVMRNDLCVEVRESIGDDFIKQIPASNNVNADFSGITSKELPEEGPAPESDLAPVPDVQLDMEGSGFNNENHINDDFTLVHVEKEDEILSVGAIIAISCAVAALISLYFYYEARRRNQARINRMSRFNTGNKRFEDGLIKVHTSSVNLDDNSFDSLSSTPIEDIKTAINRADWDGVYRLASRIAENDDGLSLQSLGSFKDQNRSHLGAEDQERTKTLDDLAANGDWTGLAVTAALYAGETSGSLHSQSDDSYTYSADDSSLKRDTTSVSQNEDVEGGQRSMEQMVSRLSRALNAGNWPQVTKYANLIKDEKNSGSSFDNDSQILLTTPSNSSMMSTDTSNTEMSKKQTIAKLMRAGKWKGVSIMANMYEMESKQGHPSSPLRPYPPSPNHPYSDTRSIIRTKELRHSDRVQENIVGFRRDP